MYIYIYIIYVYEFARRRNGKIKIVIKNRYVYLLYTIIYYFFITGCSEHNVYLILYVLYYYYILCERLSAAETIDVQSRSHLLRRRCRHRAYLLFIYSQVMYTRDIIIYYIIGLTICHYILPYSRIIDLWLSRTRVDVTHASSIYIIIHIHKRGVYAMYYYAYNCKDDRRKKNTSLFSRCNIVYRLNENRGKKIPLACDSE